MDKLPAITGWLWVKEGFALFRKQPAEISTLFLAYMFLMIAIGFLPLLGQILPLMLVPVFSMAFMQACANIEQGRKVYPNLLLTGFRSPAMRRLIKLGVLYLAAAVVAVGASAVVDGGVFWEVMTGQKSLDAETIRGSNLSSAMMFAAAIYTPALMAFWYAAPLVAWQDMSIGKAVFYSFFAVKRSGMAFLVYGLVWMLLGVILPAVISSFVALLVGKAFAVMLVLLSVSLMLTVVMYCSFYPTYTSIFGRPGPQPAPVLPQQ
ncbi:MAG TPA: BPSS1780 family membrane protein [Noviherbaspirillum sp.]|uniref:BPSS1780 family membrane protein n=1 Tax=Noviherbaspirillum sp. TaxID=1926288 RepID=UPI002D2ABE53|nr:BPSS1780 family membrane protein [Noviherbaspirillum sp.]HYD96383.1 BPSS1780 family membrane protein [Noviherbaspirillum sp.]